MAIIDSGFGFMIEVEDEAPAAITADINGTEVQVEAAPAKPGTKIIDSGFGFLVEVEDN